MFTIKIPLRRLLVILSVLVGASIACNLPARGATTPPPSPTLSPEEIRQLEEQLRATLENPQEPAAVTITVTEQQLTSFVASEVASMDNPPLTNPQVVLVNGQIEIYGVVNQAGISANAKTVLQPRIDAEGNPKLDVVSINIGPFPVPDSFKNQVEEMVDDTLSNYLMAQSDRFQVTDIQVSDGRMAVSGMRLQ
jgi:uncharacterized protein YpmS